MNNLPTNLMNQLKDLHDNFEDYFRRCERDRVLKALRNGGLPQDYQHKGVRIDQDSGARHLATGNDTDMHGNPLAVDDHMANKSKSGWVKLSANDVKILGYLEKGFIAVPTLAGVMGFTRQSIHAAMWRLKQHGHEIEARPTGKRKHGYDKIYRIKSASNNDVASG